MLQRCVALQSCVVLCNIVTVHRCVTAPPARMAVITSDVRADRPVLLLLEPGPLQSCASTNTPLLKHPW